MKIKKINILKIFGNLYLKLSYRGFFKDISDEKHLKRLFKIIMGYDLDLNEPKTFNEKMQWLKIHDRNSKYSTMVDKYEAKKYVSNIIGEQYIIPTLGVFNSFDEIDFDSLPNQFVIKCTHDSGGLVIVKDKTKINLNMIKDKINNSIKTNYYYFAREWPYKDIKPRIIIEKYMEDEKSESMRDYKFFCFNGEPKIMYISEGLENHKTARMSFYDMDFKLTSCKRRDYKQLEYKPNKPINYKKMIEFSKLLSKNIPHLRVDWYEINGQLYFGELTFFTCSGFIPFEDSKWDYELGNYLNIQKR